MLRADEIGIFSQEALEAIALIADASAPHECCGFIVDDDEVIQAQNTHEDPESYFRIHPYIYRNILDQGKTIKAIFHSHVNGYRDFSSHDIKASHALAIPFLMYYQKKPEFFYYDPARILPYLERDFHFAYRNCYTLVCDYFKQELGIDMVRYYPDRPDQWDEVDFDPLGNTKPQESGFVQLPPDTPLKQHDVVLMRIGNQASAAHCGIITDPIANAMLHHLSDRLSEKCVYGGWYRDNTVCIFRHQSQL